MAKPYCHTVPAKATHHVEVAQQYLERGHRDSIVVQLLAKSEGITKRQAYRVLGKAWQVLISQHAKSAHLDATRLENALETLLEHALVEASKGDVRAIVAGTNTAMSLAKLRGLIVDRSSVRVDVRQQVEEKVTQMTTAERHARIQQLLTEAGMVAASNGSVSPTDSA
ncbi:MAG: hypothetical protein V2A73_15950 [Pseudomonadota bacterium]